MGYNCLIRILKNGHILRKRNKYIVKIFFGSFWFTIEWNETSLTLYLFSGFFVRFLLLLLVWKESFERAIRKSGWISIIDGSNMWQCDGFFERMPKTYVGTSPILIFFFSLVFFSVSLIYNSRWKNLTSEILEIVKNEIHRFAIVDFWKAQFNDAYPFKKHQNHALEIVDGAIDCDRINHMILISDTNLNGLIIKQ